MGRQYRSPSQSKLDREEIADRLIVTRTRFMYDAVMSHDLTAYRVILFDPPTMHDDVLLSWGYLLQKVLSDRWDVLVVYANDAGYNAIIERRKNGVI